jgi:capsular exopolysaccharide synthesis family protein
MERVTAKNDFNISYYKLASIRKIDLYTDVPFQLTLLSNADTTNTSPVEMSISGISNAGGTLEYGASKKKTTSVFHWGVAFETGTKKFILTHNRPVQNLEGNYMIRWMPVKQAAEAIENSFSVDVLDKKTSIIKLEIVTENLRRGQDILNSICREFNLADLEEKNAVAEKTNRFINERLAVVSNELSGVEGNLENYQGNNQIVNVASQSSQNFENENDISKNITSVNVQQGVVKMIEDYFNNADNKGKLVPSSLGINDATLASLIAHYNELQLQKEKEAPSLAPNSVILRDITNQINSLKSSILENLQNITKNLYIQETSLQQKNSQYRQFLSALPHKERMIQEIKRKQSITEGLYLYLLQKREETSISASSSNVSIYKQIDDAKGYGPVSPNARNIQLYSIAFGLLIPIGIIRLRDMLNDKITRKTDITTRTQIPVIGELSHIRPSKNDGIVVQSRDLIAEQFRLLRTNLSFIRKTRESQVILITSSTTNEGKSLVSLNLAAVLATPGNKVALLEFDMRLPAIFKMVDMDATKGLSEYLSGEAAGIDDIRHEAEEIKSLHIFPAGAKPASAADLLLSEKLPGLIAALKQEYDYIIIDTAPVGLVTDAFILGKYCDAVMYIIRQNYTLKKQLDNVNDIYKLGKFSDLCIVFNDIRMGGKYGFGYEYQKAYEYSYGSDKKHGLLKRLVGI